MVTVMTDLDRLNLLQTRWRALELQQPLPSERSILEAAREALREEIGQLGRRLMRDRYWRPVPIVHHAQAPGAGERAGEGRADGPVIGHLRPDGSWRAVGRGALERLKAARRKELS